MSRGLDKETSPSIASTSSPFFTRAIFTLSHLLFPFLSKPPIPNPSHPRNGRPSPSLLFSNNLRNPQTALPAPPPALPPQRPHRVSKPVLSPALPSAPFLASKALQKPYNTDTTPHSLTLSTPSLDVLLCTTTYTLTLLSSLTALLSPTSTKTPLSKPRFHLPSLLTHLSNLRLSLRLWGLLPIYTSLLALLRQPPKDAILRYVAYMNIILGAAFQLLENVAFLGDLGVLRAGRERTGRWWLWSSRFWMLGVMGEGGRLWREGVLQRRNNHISKVSDNLKALALDGENERAGPDTKVERAEDALGEKEEKLKQAQVSERWWRQVVSNAAWAPLTVHWSVEGGMLGDGAVGALGMVAGGMALREAWRRG